MSEELRIGSDALSATISTCGAEPRTLADAEGRALLWDGDPAWWTGRAPILFPVIGVLAGGAYRLDGKSYAMPKHGFARHSEFEVAARDDASVLLRLDANDATRAIYPFQFRLDLNFSIEDAALTIAATIANRGDTPMPASFGFHPALRWPLPYGAPRAAHRIRFARTESAPIRRIDGAGLLCPTLHPTPVEGDTLRLRDALFEDDALIFDALASRAVRYGADGGPQLDVRFADFPTLGVWTKPGAGYVCIEPWQGIADPAGFAGDIWEKPGIVAVAPGEARALAMTIALTPSAARG